MTSIPTINETERMLLQCLGQSLKQSESDCQIPDLEAGEWERVYELADRHEVAVLLGNLLNPDSLPQKIRKDFQLKTVRTVHKGITLQSLNSRLTARLEKAGITAVTLKGFAVSRLYPVPEFRKTTDIDLFLFCSEDAEKAGRILCENGFQFSKEWHANHHFVLYSEKKEEVELHTAWTEDFKDKRLNRCLKKIQKESKGHCISMDCDGAGLYVYETAYQGFYLLIHMLQHFVGSGFGLRNLCDWVVLWRSCDDPKAREDFLQLACESGTAEFAKAVTAVCVEYLGLDRDKSPLPAGVSPDKALTDEFLRDILDAGEFGYSQPERMVGMDGDSFAAYVKEFHHQMHINFPKAGRVILLWPFLWLATLIRFLKNNRKLNRAPIAEIMKKAGKRGGLVRRLMPKQKKGG